MTSNIYCNFINRTLKTVENFKDDTHTYKYIYTYIKSLCKLSMICIWLVVLLYASSKNESFLKKQWVILSSFSTTYGYFCLINKI